MSRIMAIEERTEGQYELRGNTYYSFNIYNLDFLDKISKKHILDKDLVTKWKKAYGDDVVPINDVDWSFDDIYEDYYNNQSKQIIFNQEENEFSEETLVLDLENASQKDLTALYEMKESSNSEDSYFEDLLKVYFSEEDVAQSKITELFKFDEVRSVKISVTSEHFNFKRDIII